MNEPLSEVIRIQVTSSHAARLGEAAALSGLSLSNYIRRRLSADDTLQEELTPLRKAVAGPTNRQRKSIHSSGVTSRPRVRSHAPAPPRPAGHAPEGACCAPDR